MQDDQPSSIQHIPRRLWPWGLLLAVGLLLLLGCQSNELQAGIQAAATPPPQVEPATVPILGTLRVEPASAVPNQTVTLQLSGFPAGAPITVQLDSVEPALPLGQGIAGADGQLTLSARLPTFGAQPSLTEGQERLTLTATSLTVPAVVGTTDLELRYAEQWVRFTDELSGFSILIPQNWEVGEAVTTPLGELRQLGLPPLQAGNPATSQLLIARRGELDARQAAEQLLCGGGCLQEVRLQRVELNGRSATQFLITGENIPPLIWYFVENGPWLIYFTLNDPVSLRSLLPLLESLELTEPQGLEETNAAAASADPSIAANPTAAPFPTATLTPPPTSLPTRPPATPTLTLGALGPVDIVINLMYDVIRNQVDESSYQAFSSALRLEARQFVPLGNILFLEAPFVAFDIQLEAETEQGILVRGEFTDAVGEITIRFFEMVREDEIWRIDEITAPLEPLPTPEGESAPTATPEATDG